MPRFLIKLAYDGSLFSGWQIQPQVRTVQQTVESALSAIARKSVPVTGSGRTDAQVHAQAQYAHFDLSISILPQQLIKALNSHLPDDVRVYQCWQVRDDFSARYDATQRTYQYHLARHYSPFKRHYAAWLPRFRFTPPKLRKCLPYFYGEHDFSAFAQHNPDLKHYRCQLQKFELSEQQDEIVFEISANRFLHNMVRRLVGTCLRIAHTDADPAVIKKLLANKDPRNNLIYCAPPQGLFLVQVNYPELKHRPDSI